MARTTLEQEFTFCPACRKPITAVLVVDIDQSEVQRTRISENSDITIQGKIVGAQVDHNCIPSVPRGNLSETARQIAQTL